MEFSLEDASNGIISTSIDRVAAAGARETSNKGPPNRPRLTHDGVVTIEIAIDPGAPDTISYTLAVRRVSPATPREFVVNGGSAFLSLRSESSRNRVSIVPLSTLPRIRDRLVWSVIARGYHVALTRDSLYEVCRVPCSHPDTVKLAAGDRVERILR